MKIKDNKRFHGGMNTDDNPANLPDGDYTDAINVRTLSSAEQHGAGLAETLQSEIELLINPNSLITYYGASVGGQFVYEGYEEVAIGTQTWMKKNYDSAYPGSKVYDNEESNTDIYGRLYTHGQVMTAGFCPDGWRVPTEADIDTLLAYLGGAAIAGGRLKESGEQQWAHPNTGATDIVGFRAVPGGKFDILFDLLGDNCLLWLVDEGEPVAPVAINGSAKTAVQFVANWLAVEGVTGYYLDVATDVNFTAFVAGWNNKDVGNVLYDIINGLAINTPYYYRVRAYNEIGASPSSNTVTLSTLNGVLDVDGNVYGYITIGTQQWMIENFRSTKYRDTTPIPNLTLDADWAAEDGTAGHDGAYCYYNNNIANKADYGALYNWFAIDNAHELTPVGWRVPSSADFAILSAFLGGNTVAGGKLKEIGLSHWDSPNFKATDDYDFKAMGAGRRNDDGPFAVLKTFAQFWTSTEYPFWVDFAYYILLSRTAAQFIDEYNGSKKDGYSIRLMRDTP